MYCALLIVGLASLAMAVPTSNSTGPCMTSDKDYAAVMDGTACFAANQLRGDVLGCVDAVSVGDAGMKACKCWGCVGPRLGDWMHQIVKTCTE